MEMRAPCGDLSVARSESDFDRALSRLLLPTRFSKLFLDRQQVSYGQPAGRFSDGQMFV